MFHIVSLVASTELCALGFQELVKNGAAMNKQLKDSRYCLNTFPRFMAKHRRVLMIVVVVSWIGSSTESVRACKDIEDEILRLLSAEGDILESKEFYSST